MLLKGVWFDIIAIVETLKPLPTENPTLSIEYLDGQLEKLADLTKEEWKQHWKTPGFPESFPNLMFRLVSLDSRNKYTQEQKQRIFKLGFESFMELPWKTGGVAVGGKKVKVNKENQLWENTKGRQVDSDGDALITIEIGCFILLGLSLNNQKDIIEAYNKLEKADKKISFRSHITSELISTQSAFKYWVKANNLDKNNGFKWDSEVTNLVLRLFPQSRLPRAFLHPTNYPLTVIDTVVNDLLTRAIPDSWRSDINVFQSEVAKRIKSGDFGDDPDPLNELKEKLNKLNSHIGSTD